MKKLLLSALATLLVVGAGFAVAGHYADYQNKQAKPEPTISVAQADKKVANVKAAATTDHQALVAQYNAQVTECQKGKVAYDKLTPAIKAQTPAPTCGTPQ